MEKLIQDIYAQARKLGACDLFTGRERTVEDIVRLFMTPQGMEFCMEHRFPDIATLRRFKPFNVERWGVYIDAGLITLTDPAKAVIVGDTTATVNCRAMSSHTVYLMRGARAVLNASGWTVVRAVSEEGCGLIKNVKDNAIIL
jgi:hypothetical protein